VSHKCHSILLGKNGSPLAEIASVSADLPHGHVIPEHSHPEDQLLFASKGVMTLRTKQGVWVVRDASDVDSGGHAALGEHVRTGFDEDSLPLPKLCRNLRRSVL